jgi:lipopolysaccharide export system protein LptA
MISRLFLIFYLIAFPIIINAQADNVIKVVGDSLVGKVINGESIREVYGNVIMTQGKVRITCLKAIQYLAKNEVELLGNVVVVQDSVVIKTSSGYYYGDSKTAYSNSGVSLFDGHIKLESKNGFYYTNEKKAYFFDNVILKDEASTIWTERLHYFNDDDKLIASGNVKVVDSTSVIYADSLIHNRKDQISFAFKNVKVFDPENKLAIFGNQLENYQLKKYSKMIGNPIMIKIDTTDAGEIDTLFISARMMESFNDSTDKLIASDSVRIFRGEVSSINNYTVLFRNKDNLVTFKKENDVLPPVLWNENSQLIGDTVNILLEDNRLKEMIIDSNASIISFVKNYDTKFDQISGKQIKMYFGGNGLERTEVFGKVLSIYYLFEDGEPNGLLKSSSENAFIYFKDNEVVDVKFYGNPSSEYHPENMIAGKEKEFTIPTFRIIENRPNRESFLNEHSILLLSLIKEIEANGK